MKEDRIIIDDDFGHEVPSEEIVPSSIPASDVLSKSQFLENLRKRSKALQELRLAQDQDVLPKLWGRTEKERASKILEKHNTAAGLMSTIPLRCRSEDCPYKDGCPLLKAGLDPKGETCPIEMHLLISMYLGFCEELLINPDQDFIDAALVRDLCNVLIQEVRTEKILANEHFVTENVVGVDRDGNPTYRKEPHIAIMYSEKLHKKKMEIMEVLLATRIAKVKAAKTLGATIAEKNRTLAAMGDLLLRLSASEKQKEREEVAYEIEEAEFEELNDEGQS